MCNIFLRQNQGEKCQVSLGATLTVALVVGPTMVFITEAAIKAVFLTTPLILCAVQLVTGI